MKHITSRQNPLVARYRAIAAGDHDTCLLLDGIHLVRDALDAGLRITDALVSLPSADGPELAPLVARLAAGGVDVCTAAPSVLAAVSPVRSASPIVAAAGRPMRPAVGIFARQPTLLVAAVDVQDPGNVGAIARVSEAGGATGLAIAGRSADPFGWKALRGSMGSALRLPLVHPCDVSRLVADARQHGCRVVASVPRGGSWPEDTDLCGPVVILVGGEGAGLARPIVDGADDRVSIPMEPPVESLNTAVCAALLVYEARRQRSTVPAGAAARRHR